MRQITDPRAPFASIDEAMDVGLEHARALGLSVMGMVAEDQPGGYFVRIAGTRPVNRGGRAGRNRRQSETVEVGKIDGPWLQPLNDTTLSGKPWFFCAGAAGFSDEWEPAGTAQARLLRAHQAGKRMPRP